MLKLWDFQEDLVNQARAAYQAGNKHVLIQSATGSGKSVISSAIVKGAITRENKCWFVVPRVELMKQMSTTFSKFDIPHRYITSGEKYFVDAPSQICTLQTLVKRFEFVKPPDFVVIDETHYGGKSVDTLVWYARDRGLRTLGLSATPARSDNFGMADWYQSMVRGPSIRSLIDRNFLSRYKLVRPDAEFRRGVQVTDHVESWVKYSGGRKTIAYTKDIQHSKKVALDFCNAGIPAAHMDAGTPAEERRRIIEGFADGKIKIICNVFLLTFGFDLAAQVDRAVNVRCVLDLAATESLTSQLQKWGRALRYDPDGEAVIIDLAGNSMPGAHGFPCAERDWILSSEDLHVRDVEIRERALRTVLCKSCFMPSKLGPLNCPHCGEPFSYDGKKIRVIDGELIEISPEQMQQEEEAARRRARSEVGRTKTMDDLWKIARERGYKPGWVYKQAQLKGISS